MNHRTCENRGRTNGIFAQLQTAKTSGKVIVSLLITIIVLFIIMPVIFVRVTGRHSEVTDAQKWIEARATMGAISCAIRAYRAEIGPAGTPPSSLYGYGSKQGLGFEPGDLTGCYFSEGDFTFSVTSMEPLIFTISCTPTTKDQAPANPATVTLDQDRNWTPPQVGPYKQYR